MAKARTLFKVTHKGQRGTVAIAPSIGSRKFVDCFLILSIGNKEWSS